MSMIEFLKFADRHRLLISLAVLFLTLLVGYFWPLVHLDENQKLYIFSTQAQIIAGVYALTVAGYVFMTEQRLRLVDSVSTLKTTVDAVAYDQYRGMLFLAAVVLVCLCSCLMSLLLKNEYGLLPMFLMNLAGVSFSLGVAFIVLFVCQAMHPKLLEYKSDQIKQVLAKQAENISNAEHLESPDGELEIEPEVEPESDADGKVAEELDDEAVVSGGDAQIPDIPVIDVKGIKAVEKAKAVEVAVNTLPPVTLKVPRKRLRRVGPSTYTIVGENDYGRFMREYIDLEKAVRELLFSLRKKRLSESKRAIALKIMPMSRLVDELVSLQGINPSTADRLLTISKFRNVLVHSSNTIVTEPMIQLAKSVKSNVMKALKSLD